MKRSAFLIMLCLGITPFLSAQEDTKNILIKEAKEEYRYVKGNSTNPVKIEQEMDVTYFCNAYRTSFPIVEFYNDQIQLNDVDVKVDRDKIKNFKPNHDYYSSDGIFYSDARVCYFTLPLEKKGSTSQVKFKKTVLDPRYFTSIFFAEPYEIQQKEVRIVVPKWMKIEIKEFNFKDFPIVKNIESKGNEDIYTYTITNAPAVKKEENSPGPTYTAPHVLIMNKYAEPSGEHIIYFNTLADQYNWYRQLVKQIGNDPAVIKAKAEEITKGINGDMEKVKALFQWVQDNVRYIAFEDGIAGFKPAKAQDVLHKKYGDCKGMGNLMAEMLKAIGLDGRLCWLGTNHIAYDYSTPSLGVDNHMIAAWKYNGKIYFLDPTEKYIGFGEIAERIQGRQVLIEDGDKYLLQNIAVAASTQNTSYEKRTLSIKGNDLIGKVVQVWKGENKEWLLSHYLETKKERQEDLFKRYLSEGSSNFIISNLKILNLNDYNKDIQVEYDLLFKDAVSSFNKELYVDIDNRKDYAKFKFDLEKRKLPYVFPFKNHVVFETELQLPDGIKPNNLPAPLKVEHPNFHFNAEWLNAVGKLTYRREIDVRQTTLTPQQFEKWNEAIGALNAFYNNQLTLVQ